jgi:hypothetical protein
MLDPLAMGETYARKVAPLRRLIREYDAEVAKFARIAERPKVNGIAKVAMARKIVIPRLLRGVRSDGYCHLTAVS